MQMVITQIIIMMMMMQLMLSWLTMMQLLIVVMMTTCRSGMFKKQCAQCGTPQKTPAAPANAFGASRHDPSW